MKGKRRAFTLIAMGLAISIRPLPGQTISYFRRANIASPDNPDAVGEPLGVYGTGQSRSAVKFVR